MSTAPASAVARGDSSAISTPRFTVEQIAERLGGEVGGDGRLVITGINSLEDAGPGEITFISSGAYAKRWDQSKAAAAIVSRNLQPHDSRKRPLIVVADAEIATITLLEMFQQPEPVPDLGVHPSAAIHPSATLARGVRIGPHVSIDAGATIGDGVVLHAGVRIYRGVRIGPGSVLHANTVIRHDCVLGRRVILHQNVSIGADGFGYRPDPSKPGLLKVPQIGNVIIEDGVEIGANTCIDRAKFGSTIIGAGTKIDNLVQVAHNCRIGRCCVIAGCVGISGSVTIGDGVQIGGGVGISDHISVGAGARIGGMAFVTRDVPAGQNTLGYPAQNAQAVLRQWVTVRKLPGLLGKLDEPSTGPGH